MKIWWKTRFVISSKCRILLFGFVRINHLARQYLESFVIKKRDKKAALKFMNKAMRRCGSPNEIVTDKGPTVQQQENWAVRKSRLLSDGQTTELKIHTYPFADEKGPCFGLGACIVYKVRLNPCLVSQFVQLQRSLSKRSTFKLNRDAALTEWRSLVTP